MPKTKSTVKVELDGEEIRLLDDLLGDAASRWFQNGSVEDPDETEMAARIIQLKVKLQDFATGAR